MKVHNNHCLQRFYRSALNIRIKCGLPPTSPHVPLRPPTSLHVPPRLPTSLHVPHVSLRLPTSPHVPPRLPTSPHAWLYSLTCLEYTPYRITFTTIYTDCLRSSYNWCIYDLWPYLYYIAFYIKYDYLYLLNKGKQM